MIARSCRSPTVALISRRVAAAALDGGGGRGIDTSTARRQRHSRPPRFWRVCRHSPAAMTTKILRPWRRLRVYFPVLPDFECASSICRRRNARKRRKIGIDSSLPLARQPRKLAIVAERRPAALLAATKRPKRRLAAADRRRPRRANAARRAPHRQQSRAQANVRHKRRLHREFRRRSAISALTAHSLGPSERDPNVSIRKAALQNRHPQSGDCIHQLARVDSRGERRHGRLRPARRRRRSQRPTSPTSLDYKR